MDVFVTILIIIVCLGLILFVLVQNPKGGGLNTEFGSAVQLGGAKRATDILEKGTWGLAIGVGVLCLFMAFNSGGTEEDGVDLMETNTEELGPAGGETAPPGGTSPVAE
jgi:preprotein translocase subunit SecG